MICTDCGRYDLHGGLDVMTVCELCWDDAVAKLDGGVRGRFETCIDGASKRPDSPAANSRGELGPVTPLLPARATTWAELVDAPSVEVLK